MFGQLVLGAPGSGKTTFCTRFADFLQHQRRAVCVVNLDPANDELPYACDVDVTGLVSLDEVQRQLQLGPNGGLLYCMDFIEKNLDWLKDQLAPHVSAAKYFLFDCPGQAELYVCHSSFQKIVETMTREWHFRLTAVQLVDSHLCTSPAKFLSGLLITLSSMLHLELPYVNVLTKVDLLQRIQEGSDVDLENLTDVSRLRQRLETDESLFMSRYKGLSTALCEVVEDYGLVRLLPLSVDNLDQLLDVQQQIDQANGYSLCGIHGRRPC